MDLPVGIKELISLQTPNWITVARAYSAKLNMHINGVGITEFLGDIDGYENSTQKELRDKYATSNKFLFSKLLTPVNKVFSAKGGNTNLNIPITTAEETASNTLADVWGGYSVHKWVKSIYRGNLYYNPSGVTMMEWKDKDAYPTIKTIENIRNYKATGRKLEWILFEPTEKKGTKGEFYRFVNKDYDYTIHCVSDNCTVVDAETYPNPWGDLQAWTNGDQYDHTLSYHLSPIDAAIELADHYLRTTSIKNIYEFLHGYPIFWALVEPCRECAGTGLKGGGVCPVCNGEKHTFKKDVSDVLKIKPPRTKEDPLISDPAGYIQPELETWKEQRTELDWLYSLLQYTMWGSVTNDSGSNETATGRFIDIQPVNDKLNEYAEVFEATEKLITDSVIRYSNTDYTGSSVSYGRRFIVEPPDVLWKNYLAAKIDGAAKTSLDYLLDQFYQSEFINDMQGYLVAKKSIQIEPFIHKTDEEILLMPISDEDKLKKIYFNEWFKQIPSFVILNDTIETLNIKFNKFTTTKKLKNETKKV